jgi:hypothetical protein
MLFCDGENVKYLQDFLSNQDEVTEGWENLLEELCDVWVCHLILLG